MEKPTKIILCADDYALSPGVSRAIRHLVLQKRVSATSIMVTSHGWEKDAEALKQLTADIDIGLHITLTDQTSLSNMPTMAPKKQLPTVGSLLKNSIFGQINKSEIRGEIEQQIAAFQSVMGRFPDYLDGHHHVHQFPQIRDVFVNCCQSFKSTETFYVRATTESVSTILKRNISIFKTIMISIFGQAFKSSAVQAELSTNTGFSGMYNYAKSNQERLALDMVVFRDAMNHFLIGARENMIIMCHPGFVDKQLIRFDSLTWQREAEYKLLASKEHANLLAQHGVMIGRFSRHQ